MGTGIRYTNEFKQEAVNQVSVHGYDVSEVAKRLGVRPKACTNGRKNLQNQPKSVRNNTIFRQKLPVSNVN
ncbi:hypothetical protein LCGC14_0501330 [marine sediment metagenome]|uniref:Transposase n=1 Tax=marine sediment metagenome TaxID=412755 RepID=A0A0F9SM86_9ZZZZ